MDLLFFDVIGYYPATPTDVSAALRSVPTSETITVKINSGGGSAFDGEAIRALLAAAPNRVEVEILGMAASAASLIAMAGDVIRMTENSAMMIHRATVGTGGNADTLRSDASMLDALDAGATRIYAARSGKSEEQVRAWLDAETWFTPAEAVAAGLADEIIPAEQRVAASYGGTLPDHIRHVLALRPQLRQNPPMFSKELLARLGLPEGATEEQVLAAIDARQGQTAEPTPAPAQSISLNDVARVVRETLQAQTAAAQAVAGPQQAAQLHAAAAQSAVERFISEGKIHPAGRAQAVAACGDSAVQLNAAVAYWENAPRIVPAPAPQQALDSSPAARLTPLQQRMCRDAGISPEQFLAQAEKEKARQAARVGGN